MSKLLERKTTTRTASPEEADDMTRQLLSRRAGRAQPDPDNPFPYVASLPPKSGAPEKPAASTDEGYTNRLLDAKKRAKEKED